MSTISHTPGPWNALFDDDEEYHGAESADIEHEGGGQIAKVYGTDNFPCLEATEEIRQEFIANAKVVAAAPDLFSALTRAESFVAGWEDDEEQVEAQDLLATIRAALAKARHVTS